MGYWYLTIAIITEVLATSALKESQGFSKLMPSLLVIAGYGASFYFLSLVLQTIPVGVAYALWAGLLKNLRQRSDGRYYWHWDPAIHSSASSPDYIEAMARRMEEAARLIDVPTLVVRGGQSRVVSPEGVAHLAELIPHAGYVDVAAAGHMVAGDQNDEFNAVIREFLASSCGSA